MEIYLQVEMWMVFTAMLVPMGLFLLALSLKNLSHLIQKLTKDDWEFTCFVGSMILAGIGLIGLAASADLAQKQRIQLEGKK